MLAGSAESCRVWKCSKCWLGNLSTLQTHNFERTQHPDIDEKNFKSKALKILHNTSTKIFGMNVSKNMERKDLFKFTNTILMYVLIKDP